MRDLLQNKVGESRNNVVRQKSQLELVVGSILSLFVTTIVIFLKLVSIYIYIFSISQNTTRMHLSLGPSAIHTEEGIQSGVSTLLYVSTARQSGVELWVGRHNQGADHRQQSAEARGCPGPTPMKLHDWTPTHSCLPIFFFDWISTSVQGSSGCPGPPPFAPIWTVCTPGITTSQYATVSEHGQFYG